MNNQIEIKLVIGEQFLSLNFIGGCDGVRSKLKSLFGIDPANEMAMMIGEEVVKAISESKEEIIEMAKKEIDRLSR